MFVVFVDYQQSVSLDTHGTMAGQIMTSCIENCLDSFYSPGKLHSFTSLVLSFVLLIFAGCRVCIPSFSVPKRGSMSDLEKVVPHSILTAAKKARMRKGIREYCTGLSKMNWWLCRRNKPRTRPSQHIRESKDSQVHLWEWLIRKYFTTNI